MTRRQEHHCLAVLLGLWFAVNLATLERAPTVWLDEVLFTDPAIHWVQGRGLTSTAWPQPPGTPALLNGPLYTLLLCGWLKAWTLAGAGPGVSVVRGLNLALAAVAAVWLWCLVRRRGAVASPWLRLGGVAVLLCANGVSAAYRSGRYDMVGLLLLVALGSSVERGRSSKVNLVALLVLGGLVPFAGLYLVPYCLLLAVGAVLCGGREWLQRVVPALVGLAAGGVALVGMHLWFGTFPYFLAFTRKESGTPIALKLSEIPANIVRDLSVVPLLGFLGVCLVVHLRRRDVPLACLGRRLPWALLGLLAGIVVPASMTLAGKYPRFYSWMVFVPVLATVLCSLERACRMPEQRAPGSAWGAGWLAWLGAVALGASLALGLPLRTLVCVREWAERDYREVSEFVQAQLRPGDRVLVGYSAYYPVTQVADTWYLPEVLGYTPPADVAAITCIIEGPDYAGWMVPRLGGEWQKVAEHRVEPRAGRARLGRALLYHLTVYRRAPRAGAAPAG